VETIVEAMLTSADDTPLGKLGPCVIHKLANSLKLSNINIVTCSATEDAVQIVNWYYYNLTQSFITLLLLYTNTRQTLK
jgi:hypothetical protein